MPGSGFGETAEGGANDGGWHVSVLVEECLHFLAPERGGVFVDCTLGLGGHARALLEANPELRLVGIDRDAEALEIARRELAEFGERVEFLRGTFEDLEELLQAAGHAAVAGILADLGVSSLQLERAHRGFSFRRDGPLDMRMDTRGGMTAADVVNGYPEEQLRKILSEYGEERRARRIARQLVLSRQEKPLETTGDLRAAVVAAVGSGRPGRIDPATRTFQAVRIEVNRELAGLDRFFEQTMRLLESDGRLVVISYHSLEDRISKMALRSAARGEVDPITGRPLSETRLIELLTKKPVRPTEAEVTANPRSRSARLRAARRI